MQLKAKLEYFWQESRTFKEAQMNFERLPGQGGLFPDK